MFFSRKRFEESYLLPYLCKYRAKNGQNGQIRGFQAQEKKLLKESWPTLLYKFFSWAWNPLIWLLWLSWSPEYAKAESNTHFLLMTRTWASKMTHVVLKNENHPEHGNTLYSGYYIKIQKIIFTPKDTFWHPFNAAFARMYWLDVVKNIWFEIFNHKSNSNEDIHLAHIEPLITSVDPLTDHWATIVFQPMARASPASTKTNWRPVRGSGVVIMASMCSWGLPTLENHLWSNIRVDVLCSLAL